MNRQRIRADGDGVSRRTASRLIAYVTAVVVAASVQAVGPSDIIGAVRSGEADVVRGLLRQKINVTEAQPDGTTALHWAVYQDYYDIADALLRAGAAVNATNQLGVTPLYLACENGSGRMVARLLRAGASANVSLPSGESALMTAARSGSAEAVKALLAKGAEVNAREKLEGQTALMWAVSQRHPDVVTALIEGGADVRARSRIRQEVVVTARGASAGDEDTAWANALEGGYTPILFAARVGDIESAQLLLASGAEINDTRPDGATALVVAAHSGHEAFGTFLLKRGADPNLAGAGYTALHAAILRGLPQLVDALISRGANVNAKLEKGTVERRQSKVYALQSYLVGATPFFLAAKYNEPMIMRKLAAAGADPLAGLKDGSTPLMAAAGMRLVGLARVGSDRRGRDMDAADQALALSQDKDIRSWVESGIDAVKLAVELGNDINAVAANGDTALHSAAYHGFDSDITFLVTKGARLDVKNKRGQTPLMVAMSRQNADDKSIGTTTVELLRELAAKQVAPR
jgi:ankyrin repeat protein